MPLLLINFKGFHILYNHYSADKRMIVEQLFIRHFLINLIAELIKYLVRY